MRSVSVLNDVLGPIMRGPSSSHTAAAWRISTLARNLLGEGVAEAEFTFDPWGSWGVVYDQQGSDLAFAAGLLGWSLEDARFFDALKHAPGEGVTISFRLEPLPWATHPNDVRLRLRGQQGDVLEVRGRSIGGGAIEMTAVEGVDVLLRGDSEELFVEASPFGLSPLAELLSSHGPVAHDPIPARDTVLFRCTSPRTPSAELLTTLRDMPEVRRIRTASPFLHVLRGRPLFESAEEACARSLEEGKRLGALARASEAQLLGLSEEVVEEEMRRREQVMTQAVLRGLRDEDVAMRLLPPSAGSILRAEAEGRLPLGGILTRAAARAMAAMHVNSSMGVVCAAPTGGSAGVLPGVVTTLRQDCGRSEEEILRGLFAAGAVGAVIATRATFAAEEAGCQVEIGAAGAMAAALVVEAFGGSAETACAAAAVALQNTMGSPCDPVRGVVEIPCHTRNAVAASCAFVCADLVTGGYANPLPLDETVDAAYAAGKMLPPELRCTARGGLALCPSARNMTLRR